MNFITKTLNKLFKSSNQLELNKIKPIVSKINDLEKNFLNFKNENFDFLLKLLRILTLHVY